MENLKTATFIIIGLAFLSFVIYKNVKLRIEEIETDKLLKKEIEENLKLKVEVEKLKQDYGSLNIPNTGVSADEFVKGLNLFQEKLNKSFESEQINIILNKYLDFIDDVNNDKYHVRLSIITNVLYMRKEITTEEIRIISDYLEYNPMDKPNYRRQVFTGNFIDVEKEVFIDWLKNHIELTKKP